LLCLSLLIPLAGCASDAERLAGWEQHNRSAELPVLIYEVRTAPPNVGMGFSNTGDQPITGLSLRLVNKQSTLKDAGGDAYDYDLGKALPAGGFLPGTHLNAAWDTGIWRMGCLSIANLRVTFADGSVLAAGGDQLSPYLAPPVNGQCRNGSWYMLPDSYRQLHP
ncbi:MAG TPA: hypothetical protein VFM15_06160, partial [Gammaproteobacteria bacterium]|nr:hypothetical protein [Gammaproteobacteria bacterium]